MTEFSSEDDDPDIQKSNDVFVDHNKKKFIKTSSSNTVQTTMGSENSPCSSKEKDLIIDHDR